MAPFHQVFPNKTWYPYPVFPVLPTFLIRVILLDCVILTKFCLQYDSRSPLLCTFLQLSLDAFVLDPNLTSPIHSSQTLSVRVLSWTKVSNSHVNTLTYSMVQNPSWKANWLAVSQEIPRIVWNPKIHYRTHQKNKSILMYELFNFIRLGPDYISSNDRVIGENSVRCGIKQLFSNLR